jgi:hypothetical protein
MVAGRPDTDSVIGQLTAQVGGAKLELWEENMAAVHIFGDMMTQWNIGVSGATGLRYEALPLVLRLAGVPRSDWPGVVDDVRVMERAALESIRGQ